MNRLMTFAAFAVALALAAPLAAAPTSVIGEMDIGELMARAEEMVDLDATDVVLLFDGREIAVASDGTMTTVFHQIVWISTELGIDEYADLRVPWNTTNATLEVQALRTWMDGRWWPHATNLNPTAIVETTPYGVASADDYTTMRETMLLHDGVELPCIMETVYTITRRYPAGIGADDIWLFHRHDPAVRVRYAVKVAPDLPFFFSTGHGASEPEVKRGTDGHVYVWEMLDQPRLGVPHVADPTAHAPFVHWSTWRNWGAIGDAFEAAFEASGEAGDALRDTVAALTRHEPYAPARVEAVASLVAERTRLVPYDVEHWAFAPRSVDRTHQTGYGHRLDRAVFAAALLREVDGVNSVTPLFRTAPALKLDVDVPGLSRFGEIELLVSGPDVRGVYDPGSSTFREGEPNTFDGRTVWAVTDGAPRVFQTSGRGVEHARSGGSNAANSFSCAVSLERDDDGAWSGTGVVEGSGALSPYLRLLGVGSATERFCDGVVSDVLGGADVTSSNTAMLTHGRSVVGFAFDWDPGDLDERDRHALEYGLCGAGLESRLPADVHLYNQSRTTPVYLVGPMSETLVLRVLLTEDDVVNAPPDVEVENRVGRFVQRVERDGDWLVIRRSLSIGAPTVHPEWWLDLRALLLAGENPGASTILFE